MMRLMFFILLVVATFCRSCVVAAAKPMHAISRGIHAQAGLLLCRVRPCLLRCARRGQIVIYKGA
jgi:hypothetical protein